MKQKFFLSLLAIAFAVFSANAADPQRLILTVGNVEHLNIQDNIDVVLVQGAPDDNVILMDQNASAMLNLKLSNNKLVIGTQSHLSKKQKLTVYIYVNRLKTITVDGSSQVRTEGSLNADKIDLFIDGDARVHLKTRGIVKAYSLNDSVIEIKYLSETSLAKRGY